MFELAYNSERARIVHAMLHRRLVHFIQQYTPLGMADDIVHHWLNRFYCGDPAIIILLNLDESTYQITAHAFIEVQQLGAHKIVCVHQLEYDRKLSESMQDCMAYVDNLVVRLGAHIACVEVSKNAKVYQQKYGYTCSRTMLYKENITFAQAEGVA